MAKLHRSLPPAVGWLAGFAVACSAQAAEWSIAPTMSWTMDHASNRFLSPVQAAAGQGAFLTFDAFMKRTTPTFQLDMRPSLSVQRFTTGSGSDTVNRSISASALWSHERSSFGFSAGYSDLSTLITELTTTGVVQGNTHQRQKTVGASWDLEQSEKRHLIVQLGYSDTVYVGQAANVLAGYKYPTASIGERFILSSSSSLTVTGSAGQLRSRVAGTTRDEEISIALEHSFSERFTALASVGRNDRSAAGRDHGYVGQLSLARRDERNQWKLAYNRSVSATGFGVLAQRDDANLSVTRDLAPRLNGGFSLTATRDNQGVFSGALQQQARRYESAGVNLRWASGETSTVGFQTGYDLSSVSSQPPTATAHGWHASISYTWTPRPGAFSR